MDDKAADTPGGDLAGRIAERCAALGLSGTDLAARAGMAPRYLHHLVEAGPDFDPGGFLRLAAVLKLTYRELMEGPAEPVHGQGGSAAHPVLVRLSTQECWDLVGGHGIGRLALPSGSGPVVLPVNYVVDAGTIAYRTRPGAAADTTGDAVSFQVDRTDDRLSRGWSVLFTGAAEHVDDPDDVRRLAGHPGAEPWAGGDRPRWIRLRPATVTGRRVGER